MKEHGGDLVEQLPAVHKLLPWPLLHIFNLSPGLHSLLLLAEQACGHFLMPFWTFFLATLLGKGVIKVNCQSLLLVALFMKSSRDSLMEAVERFLPARLPGLQLPHSLAEELRRVVERSISKYQAGIMSASSTHAAQPGLLQRARASLRDPVALRAWLYQLLPDTIAEAWAVFLFTVILVFAVSCVENLAQSCKATEDAKRVKAALAADERRHN